MLIGSVLFIIGLAYLLKSLGVLTDVTWSFIWPVILMLFGLALIFKRKKFWE